MSVTLFHRDVNSFFFSSVRICAAETKNNACCHDLKNAGLKRYFPLPIPLTGARISAADNFRSSSDAGDGVSDKSSMTSVLPKKRSKPNASKSNTAFGADFFGIPALTIRSMSCFLSSMSCFSLLMSCFFESAADMHRSV